VSAELFCWHRLPTWLQPRALQSSRRRLSSRFVCAKSLTLDSGVHGDRHVGLDHADFLSVNIVDSCYILLPGSFIPIDLPRGRSLRLVKIRGRKQKLTAPSTNDELACFNKKISYLESLCVTSIQQNLITEKTKPTSHTRPESEFPYLTHLPDINEKNLPV
jgi:hypothetical protein